MTPRKKVRAKRVVKKAPKVDPGRENAKTLLTSHGASTRVVPELARLLAQERAWTKAQLDRYAVLKFEHECRCAAWADQEMHAKTVIQQTLTKSKLTKALTKLRELYPASMDAAGETGGWVYHKDYDKAAAQLKRCCELAGIAP